ncbi:hypothetical protein SK128_019205 [Halocaridina rubra]|uniref:NTF2 domain-containing protein n=1 Tax=Halocaridina rubra TaxID=373956 RepID=A0AAN8X7X5_HALRR
MPLTESPNEKDIREFLKLLGSNAVMSLAKTATSNKLVPCSLNEAIDIVMLHTSDEARLFSYRLIDCKYLYEYLHCKKAPVVEKATKSQLIDSVQKLWKEKRETNNKELVPRNEQNISCSSGQSSTNEDVTYSTNVTIIANKTLQIFTGGYSCGIPNISSIRSDAFSRAFCDWFYSMVNRLQPECAHQNGDNFRSSIFFDNCSVDVYLVGRLNDEEHSYGADDSFALMSRIFKAHHLLFSPNLESGVQAYKSDHGMVKVLCCGTLFEGNKFVGIFEQEFGVVNCPTDDVWKIMNIKLNLKQATMSQMPTLPKCEVFDIVK